MVLAITAALLTTAGCNKLAARDQLNKGVQAYKAAKYETAIEHFKNAVQKDPGLINAKLYLATAYAQQYVPGVDSPDNNQWADLAIEQYKGVLEKDPNNINSTKGIAYLYMQMKKFDESREYYKKAIQIDPNDPEAYYSVGVINWTQVYADTAEAKAKLGLKVDDPIKDKADQKICTELRDKYMDEVSEGLDVLTKAIEKREDYDDAMAYLNLLYRRRADLQCDNPEARLADLKTADEWVERTMQTKKEKAEKAGQQGGIVLDEQK
jgi:tetratricopeptide (TPR) repeat protein